MPVSRCSCGPVVLELVAGAPWPPSPTIFSCATTIWTERGRSSPRTRTRKSTRSERAGYRQRNHPSDLLHPYRTNLRLAELSAARFGLENLRFARRGSRAVQSGVKDDALGGTFDRNMRAEKVRDRYGRHRLERPRGVAPADVAAFLPVQDAIERDIVQTAPEELDLAEEILNKSANRFRRSSPSPRMVRNVRYRRTWAQTLLPAPGPRGDPLPELNACHGLSR